MEHKSIIIFTDGSSRGNPGPGGYGAIITFHNKVQELGGKDLHTTNNRMEITAAIEALQYLRKEDGVQKQKIEIHTDSKYLIHGITEWIFGWQKNNWKTTSKKDVENKDLWEKLFNLTEGIQIKWVHVEGHSGQGGNERCDEIATSFADSGNADLFSGGITNYKVNLFSKTAGVVKKIKSSAKAYLYMSMVRGLIKEHKTWDECEVRVNGVKGAKFKKVFNEVGKNELVAEWKKTN